MLPSLSAVSTNPETVKTLKTVFENLRTAAKTYSQVHTHTHTVLCIAKAHYPAYVLNSEVQLNSRNDHSYIKLYPPPVLCVL